MPSNPNYDAFVRALKFDEKVTLFFGKEPLSVTTGLIHSTLRIILNDINACAEPGSNHLAFPRAMCLMVAIDLLGKMRSGSDSSNAVGLRFIAFTEFALQGPTFGIDIGEKVYEFRCALHHSYRMPTEWRPNGSKTKLSWRFRLVEDKTESRLTWDTPDKCTFINLYRLQEEIEAGISRFRSVVCGYTDPDDQIKFSSMFDKYGWLYVGE